MPRCPPDSELRWWRCGRAGLCRHCAPSSCSACFNPFAFAMITKCRYVCGGLWLCVFVCFVHCVFYSCLSLPALRVCVCVFMTHSHNIVAVDCLRSAQSLLFPPMFCACLRGRFIVEKKLIAQTLRHTNALATRLFASATHSP